MLGFLNWTVHCQNEFERIFLCVLSLEHVNIKKKHCYYEGSQQFFMLNIINIYFSCLNLCKLDVCLFHCWESRTGLLFAQGISNTKKYARSFYILQNRKISKREHCDEDPDSRAKAVSHISVFAEIIASKVVKICWFSGVIDQK
jgi:hypothetical protein